MTTTDRPALVEGDAASAGLTHAKPRHVEFYCGPGGATRGYQAAGFHVTGVDIHPQPNYCGDEFVQADALELLSDPAFLRQFDTIGAAPTCQTFAAVTDWRGSRGDHPDLLTPTLALLEHVTQPWVVENVPEAAERGPLRADWLLCGTQFGLHVKRHRAFMAGNWTPPFELLPPCHCRPSRRDLIPFAHKNERAFADAMGCTWMSKEEARQAVPPAYTEHIGRALIAHLTEGAAA